MEHKNFAFQKKNFILLAIGFIIVVVGFVMMAGGNSTEETFDSGIFNTMRIKVAPLVSLFGFLFMIFAVLYKAKDSSKDSANQKEQ